MYSIGDVVVSTICPAMSGTIVKMDKNRAIIKINRTRDYKSIGKEIIVDLSFWSKV